jgi:hypothetical protein
VNIEAEPKYDLALHKGSVAQYAFLHDCVSRCPAFAGGFGSGKTHAGLFKALDLSIANAGMPGLIVEPTYGHVTDILWPRLIDGVLEARKVPYRLNRNEHLLALPWGSRIMFRTGETPEAIVGFEVAWAWVDEAALCRREVWRQVSRRVRFPGAVLRQQYATFTPVEHSWCHEVWGCADLDGTPLPEGYKVYHGRTADNRFLPADYADMVARESVCGTERGAVDGRFVRSTHGRVYYTFEPGTHVIREDRYDPRRRLDLSFDFNAAPGVHALAAQKEGEQVFILAEYGGPALTVEAACERIAADFGPRHRAGTAVYGDASGRSSASAQTYYDVIREHLAPARLAPGRLERLAGRIDVEVPGANPSVADSCALVRQLLRDGQGRASLFIHRSCAGLIADLERVVYARAHAETLGREYTGDPHALHKGDTSLTHFSDALRYYAWAVRAHAPFRRQVSYHLTSGNPVLGS